MFVNFSNHPSELWDANQKEAAKQYGKILDMSFPKISVDCTSQEIKILANQYVQEILALKPQAVLCQGEFTFVYAVVSQLRKFGIVVLSAVSDRIVQTEITSEGTRKTSLFQFVKFRKYI